MMQTEYITTPDGTRLLARTWQQGENATRRGTVVLVHGYSEHSGRYDHVASYLVQQGYVVHAHDSRGHGGSRGAQLGYFERFDLLSDDLAWFVERVRSATDRSIFLISHSMGALLALHCMIRHQLSPAVVRGIVTSGAYLDAGEGEAGPLVFAVRKLLSPLFPKLGVRPIPPEVLSRDVAVVRSYESDPDVFHGLAPARVAAEFIAAREFVLANLRDITFPILCLHGGADKLVRPSCTQRVYEGVGSPDRSIKIYDGLYHEIFNEPERMRVLADVWVWLAAHGGTSELATGRAS